MRDDLTSAHLKYLLAIYEISRESPDVSSASIARKLGISKPSVSTMLTALMNRHLLVRERYSKVYLTDEGFLITKRLNDNLHALETALKKMPIQVSDEEAHRMASLIVTEIPEKDFVLEE